MIKKNEFHVEEYMKHQMEVRLDPEEQFDLYMYESSELKNNLIMKMKAIGACNVKHT